MERISYQDLPKGMFERLMAVEGFIKESSLPFQLLELMRLRASQLNGCAYCVDMHHKELQHAGETDLRLSSLCVWQEASCYSEKERAVLAFAEALTRITKPSMPDEVYDALLLYFNKEKISVLTLAIAQINTWNRLMKTFQFVPGNYQVQKEEAVSRH